jgi:hypothetical protein
MEVAILVYIGLFVLTAIAMWFDDESMHNLTGHH